MKKVTVAISSLALIAVLSACSSEDSDTPVTTPPPASALPGDLNSETRPADGEEIPQAPPSEDEPVDMLEEVINEGPTMAETDELSQAVEEVSEVDDLLAELDAIDEELAGIDEILEDL